MKYYLLIAFYLAFMIDVTGQKIEGTAYVSQPPSGPESYLIFESNDKIIYSIDFLQGYIGQWKISNDTIEITFTTQAGKRGVGKINPASSMDYYSYNNYISYSWEINKEAIVLIKNESLVLLQFSGSSHKERFYKTKTIDFDKSVLDISIPGDYKIASTKLLTRQDLTEYENRDFRLMRNEIFARYGYVFRSKDLNNYFQEKEWYKPNTEINSVINRCLSEIEKANIKFLLELE